MPRLTIREWTLAPASLLAAALLLAACPGQETTSASGPDQSPGRIDIAVGKDVRTFGLQQARCEEVFSGGERVLNVVAPAAGEYTLDGVPTRPDLLTARLPADLGKDKVTFGPNDAPFGAIASVADAEYEDETYPLLQVVAHAARDGADDYECTASREGDKLSVICNAAKVFPWHSPGVVPGGSFKADILCRTEKAI